MAIKVLNSTHEKMVGKTNYIRAEIIVDSAAELPAEINGNVLTMGSIAWDISTGDFYGFDSSGTWHNQNGEDTSQSNASASTLQASTIKNIRYQPDIKAADTSDSESIADDVKESEGTSEIMEEIPETETLESKEVTEDVEPLRNSESE